MDYMQSKNKNRERSMGGTVMRDHISGNALADSLDSTRARGWKGIAVGHVILTYARNVFKWNYYFSRFRIEKIEENR
jgi:hypothetical protein